MLKQEIELSISPSFGLRKSEVDPYHAEQARAAPEEGRATRPVPCNTAQLVIRHDIDLKISISYCETFSRVF